MARRPMGTLFHPSKSEQARALTLGDYRVQDRKLMSTRSENLGKHKISSRARITFMIGKIIRKRNKKYDHPCF